MVKPNEKHGGQGKSWFFLLKKTPRQKAKANEKPSAQD